MLKLLAELFGQQGLHSEFQKALKLYDVENVGLLGNDGICSLIALVLASTFTAKEAVKVTAETYFIYRLICLRSVSVFHFGDKELFDKVFIDGLAREKAEKIGNQGAYCGLETANLGEQIQSRVDGARNSY